MVSGYTAFVYQPVDTDPLPMYFEVGVSPLVGFMQAWPLPSSHPQAKPSSFSPPFSPIIQS